MKTLCIGLSVAMLAILPGAASAQTDQVRTRTDYAVEWYLTPTDFPCLTETIHVTGSLEERLHVVFTTLGGYTYQVKQNTRNMTAVGLTSGETYQYNGPMSYVENGSTDDPWVTWYPIEFTFHNINHFQGPGELPNLYLRTLVHGTFDRSTGELRVEVIRDDVLCR